MGMRLDRLGFDRTLVARAAAEFRAYV